MMTMDGEVTEVAVPPNRADLCRNLTIWLPETQDHIELTVYITELQKTGIREGDKIKIQIEKAFDVDAFARDVFNRKG